MREPIKMRFPIYVILGSKGKYKNLQEQVHT